METILVLGGTAEAVTKTQELIGENTNHNIIYSLAGRTTGQPKLNCEIRIGGFGGVDGLIKFITENNVTKIIDATHPYALQISKNARAASNKKNITYNSILRAEWEKQDGDNWVNVSSTLEAAKTIPNMSRVFLALGKQYIDVFQTRTDCYFVIRMVDNPKVELGFKSHKLLTGRPSTSIEEEITLLRENEIQIIICRNSGGEQSYRKIIAARELSIPVIMINRPD
jgi:precorrin-6A/cobalt-precorrin-6A reductase